MTTTLLARYRSRKTLYIILLCFTSTVSLPVTAQSFGAYPPGIEWKQINTPQLRVIFPTGLDNQANQVTNTITFLEQNRRSTIGDRQMKLNLILNNFGVMSNGYVTLSPFRSEFFTTPLQDGNQLGSIDWLNLLSIHEYRHALQYMNMKRGLFGLANTLFGQYTLGALMNLLVPDWYFEGDAVATETVLTHQGRGRMPYFHKGYKAIVLEDKRLSYEKARNGSYNDMVPDHYELGYLLTAYGRETYGNDLWMKVIKRTTSIRGIIYPFSQGLQLYMGKKSSGLFKEAMEFYKTKWNGEIDNTRLIEVDTLSAPSSEISHYHYPVKINDHETLVYKTSYIKSGGLYIIQDDGSEKFITQFGIAMDPYFSTNGEKVVWTTLSWHPRYDAINYNDLIIYDLNKKTKKFLLKKTSYFSPAISPDGNRIAVVECSPDLKYHVIILDAASGEKIIELPNPDNLYPTYPRWDEKGENIYTSVRKSNGEMAIAKTALADQKTTVLTEWINQIIGPVQATGNTLYFGSAFTGIDNIYAWKSTDKKFYQLTSTKYGAYEPYFDAGSNTLFFTDFHRKGHQIASLPNTSCAWEIIKPLGLDQIPELNPSFLSSEGGAILDQIPDNGYDIKKYSRLAHLIKIHSWSLTPSFESIGVYLYSNDVMSQFQISGGSDYYFNEQVFGYSLSATYGGLFPLIRLSAGRQYRSVSSDSNSGYDFSEDYLDLGLEVPFNFTSGNTIRYASFAGGYSFSSVNALKNSVNDNGLRSYFLNSVNFEATALVKQQQAIKQLTTPFGQSVGISFQQSIGSIFASQFQATYDLAFRGLFPTHNFTLTAAYKYEYRFNDYRFLDLFVYPRGYSIPAYHSMFTMQTGYHFPIFYPDFGLIGIFYIHRVRATLFADMGIADVVNVEGSRQTDGIFTSLGTELIFDTQWLNIIPLSLGFRTSLLLNRDQFIARTIPLRIEFVFPVFRL